ncbi:MAG TPA: formimidoyltetrahydrofolate cyclodeaminase [Amycolatopsis sp.]
MRDLIMSDFLKNLAVPGPAPSGGAVAALGVAQAAALLARVAGADRELRAEAELLRMHALRLAEKDAHAVGRLAGPAAGGAGAAALAACLPAADVIAAAAEAVTLAERLLSGPGPSRAVPHGKVSPDVAAVAEIARSSALTARVAIETRLGAAPGDAAIALRAAMAGVDGLAERASWVTAAVRVANLPERPAEAAQVG